MIGINTVEQVAQSWRPGEREECFVWDCASCTKMMIDHGIALPSLILSDRDLACLSDFDRVFLDLSSMLC